METWGQKPGNLGTDGTFSASFDSSDAQKLGNVPSVPGFQAKLLRRGRNDGISPARYGAVAAEIRFRS